MVQYGLPPNVYQLLNTAVQGDLDTVCLELFLTVFLKPTHI